MFTKIAISGKICTGKSTVFRELDSRLHWPTFSTGAYFRTYAITHKLKLDDAEEQTQMLTKKVDGMVKKMLRKPGNLLLDAWLGGMLAQDIEGVLKVLLISDDAVRFARFAQRENVSQSEAEKEVLHRDSSWFEKVKKIYQRSDFFVAENFDLMIDTSHLTIAEIVQIITAKLPSKTNH